MEMAVITDLAAKAVFERRAGKGQRPDLPGQFRFQLCFQDQVLVGPIRQLLKNLTINGYAKRHVSNKKHHGNLHEVTSITDWKTIEKFHGSVKNCFSPLANTKFLYNRWPTNAFQTKVGLLNAEMEEDLCTCGEVETMWHILGAGKCHAYRAIRRRFSSRRVKMMEDLGLSLGAISSLCRNAEVGLDGCYPDWNAEGENRHTWFDLHSSTTKWLQSSAGYHSRWFQRGPLRVGYVENSRAVLGLSERDALKFGLQWFASKRDEAHALKKHRDDVKHANRDPALDLGELKARLRKLVFSRRKKGLETPGNPELTKLSAREMLVLAVGYEELELNEMRSQRQIFQFFEPEEQGNADSWEVRAEIARRKERQTQLRIRRQLRSRQDAVAETISSTPLISTLLDAVDCTANNLIVDLESASDEAVEIVTGFMANATITSTDFDEEAIAQIEILCRELMMNGDGDEGI